jgi:hypothetical protein
MENLQCIQYNKNQLLVWHKSDSWKEFENIFKSILKIEYLVILLLLTTQVGSSCRQVIKSSNFTSQTSIPLQATVWRAVTKYTIIRAQCM